jgi:hypothetical protein
VAVGRLFAAVWLPQPSAIRIAVPAEQRTGVRAQLARAEGRLALARKAEDADTRTQLAAESLTLGLGAVALALGVDENTARARVRQTLSAAELERALETWRLADPLPQDDPSFRELERVCEWIRGLLDCRTPREVKLGRGVWAGAGLALVGAAAWALFSAPNLARAAVVSSSSVCPVTPAAPFGKPRLHRVIDGQRRETILAACTNYEKASHITLDLGKVRALDRAVLYGRSDCCWGTHDIPIELQLSSDGRKYVTVTSLNQPFTDDLPWRVRLDGRKGRYVRMRGPKDQVKSMVVSEIEVYGR